MYAFLNNFQGEGIKLERHPEKETETETETENERESISNEILTRERVEKWSIKEPETWELPVIFYPYRRRNIMAKN